MRAGLVQRLDHNTAKNNTHDYHQHKTKNHGSANGDQGLVEAGYGFAVELGLNLVDVLDERGYGCIESFAAGNTEPIGRASCRERVCQYVEISVVAVSLKKKTNTKRNC